MALRLAEGLRRRRAGRSVLASHLAAHPTPIVVSQRIRKEQSALNSELERKKHELAAEQGRQRELMEQLESLQQNFIASNPEKGEEEARRARQEVRNGAGPVAAAGAGPSRPNARHPQAKQRKAEIRARQKRRVKEQQRRTEEERRRLEEQIRAAEAEASAREASVEAMQGQHEAELRQARQEMADLQAEFERERAELLDTIREQNREQSLILQALSQFASPPEQSKVGEQALWPPPVPDPLASPAAQMWERSSFNEATEEWTVPLLQLRTDYRAPGNSGSKSMRLPTLGRSPTPSDLPTATEQVGKVEVEKDDVSELGSAALERQRRKLRKRLRKLDRELLRRRAGSAEGLTEWTTPRMSSPGEDGDSVGTDDLVRRATPTPTHMSGAGLSHTYQTATKVVGYGGEGHGAPRPPRPSDSARPATRRRRSGTRKPKSAKQALAMALATE